MFNCTSSRYVPVSASTFTNSPSAIVSPAGISQSLPSISPVRSLSVSDKYACPSFFRRRSTSPTWNCSIKLPVDATISATKILFMRHLPGWFYGDALTSGGCRPGCLGRWLTCRTSCLCLATREYPSPHKLSSLALHSPLLAGTAEANCTERRSTRQPEPTKRLQTKRRVPERRP